MLSHILYGQPQICELPVDMTPICADACIICDIDGFTGRHDSDVRGQVPPGFCVITTENAQWLAFQAGSTSLTVDLSVSNCDNFFLFSGIQVGLYQSFDCVNFTRISNCIGGLFQIRDGQTGRLETNVELVIGEYYYIVMDGASGDNCDWTFNVLDGDTEVDPLSSTGVIHSEDTICQASNTIFSLEKEVGVTQYLWEISGDTISYEPSFDSVFVEAGEYELCVTGSNVCNTGPRICKDIVVRPQSFGQDSIFKCVNSCLEIQDSLLCDPGSYFFTLTGINGCDSIVEYVLGNWDTSFATIDTLLCANEIFTIDGVDFTEDSFYRQLRFTSNMCDSIVEYTIRFRDSIQTFLDTSTCEGQLVTINNQILQEGLNELIFSSKTGCDSLVVFDLEVYKNALVQVDTSICIGDTVSIGGELFFEDGNYQVNLQTVEACDSIIEVQIRMLDCEIRTSINVIEGRKCFGDEEVVGFLLENGLAPLTYFWISPSGDTLDNGMVTVGEVLAFNGVLDSNFQLLIEDRRGVESNFFYQPIPLEPLRLAASLSDYNGFEISCPGEENGSLEIMANGGVSPYIYRLDDLILSQSQVNNLSAGQYKVEVIDSLGCLDSLNVTLTSPSIPLVNLGELVYPCSEDTFAFLTIEVDSLDSSGGLFFNESRVQDDGLLLNEDGNYEVNLVYGNACMDTLSFEVNRPERDPLDLPNEINIQLGDSINLNDFISLLPGEVYQWLGGVEDCVNCLSYVVGPSDDQAYILFVEPLEACPLQDTVWIRVDKGADIVFPNAFSPNQDGQNEQFLLTHPRIRQVQEIQIFNRWGNLVHLVREPGIGYEGWDGRWNSELVGAGVYIWVLSYFDFLDQELKYLSGEVTLLR